MKRPFDPEAGSAPPSLSKEPTTAAAAVVGRHCKCTKWGLLTPIYLALAAIMVTTLLLILLPRLDSDQGDSNVVHLGSCDAGNYFPLDWNHTALFLIDMFNGSVPTELARKSNLLMEYARARNATIFHLCYGCFVPLDERNDDTPIREAVAAIPECSIPPTRPDGGIPFCSNERVHVRLWPFRQRATHGGVTLEEGCDLMANDQLTFLQRQQCNYGDVSSNTLRQPRDNHPFILDPALTIRPQDVVTESTDWVFRVLKHRNISNLVFFGVDANECVLFSRDLSLLSMLSMGWPADHLFAVPELGFSSYQVQGIWVSWEKHGAYLWASALMQNFEVRSLSLINGTQKSDDSDTLGGVCLFELETFV